LHAGMEVEVYPAHRRKPFQVLWGIVPANAF
jgi:hypothetical protein